MLQEALAFAAGNQDQALDELKSFLRIPSISTLPEHAADVRRAAEFLAAELRRIGMDNVEVIDTEGHPLVYADKLSADKLRSTDSLHAPGKPTILCYGHYDVQPPDPLDEWTTPPFEPDVRNGNIYARGAVDDKGQLWMHVKALEALLKQGPLPVNVRLIAEGEEEVGGEAIAKFLRDHPERLKADIALVSDTDMFAPGLPTLCVGLRGMIYTEIEVRGARTDLHSGMYGGAAPNPFFALAGILTGLKDAEGRILIPGLLEKAEKPTDAELAAWQQLPFDENSFREHEVGSPELTGEPGYTVLERLWSRPTLEVHGMPGGFIGAGAKTVIPARATAKVSMRLVPGISPQEAFTLLRDAVAKLTPPSVRSEVRLIHSGDPVVISTDNPFVASATEAMGEVFHRDTVFVRGGGSIPIVGDFQRNLGISTLLMGFGLPDDNLHAPNEKFHLANFYNGIDSLIRFFVLAGEA